MARPRYKVTGTDFRFAWVWLKQKIDSFSIPVNFNIKAKEEFEKIDRGAEKDAEGLNVWCEKWLSSCEWKQLKNVVRAQRKRKRDKLSGQKPVGIDINRQAYVMLSTIGQRDNITLSKVIERHLGAEYNKALEEIFPDL